MTSLVIPNQTTFGQMTNSVVSRLAGLNTTVLRLNEAVTTASAGYAGTPGTEFEAATMGMGMAQANNFGVQPDPNPANAGVNGVAYADAVIATDRAVGGVLGGGGAVHPNARQRHGSNVRSYERQQSPWQSER